MRACCEKCNCSVPFLPYAHLSLRAKVRHNQQDQSKIPSFDCTELSCSSESFKMEKAQRLTDGKKIIGKLWMSSEVQKKKILRSWTDVTTMKDAKKKQR